MRAKGRKRVWVFGGVFIDPPRELDSDNGWSVYGVRPPVQSTGCKKYVDAMALGEFPSEGWNGGELNVRCGWRSDVGRRPRFSRALRSKVCQRGGLSPRQQRPGL